MYIESDSAPEAEIPEPATPDLQPEAAAVHPFAAVPDTLHGALARRGFDRLTTVQEALLAADDGESDLRITSQTGSGKTVAIGFALARDLHDDQRKGPTTLLIAPTRELAMQVREELAWLFADLRGCICEAVTGGTSVGAERMRLKKRPEVLVGTPGRLLDHVRTGALDLSSVHQLVLDEADQMLDLGFKDELDAILAELPEQRRTHLVSATFASNVRELADRFQKNPVHVAGQKPGAAHADIEHIAMRIPARSHYAALVNLLLMAGDDRTLVFVRTREDTATLADKLAVDGFSALPISGDLAQSQRTRTLAAFKRGAVRTLIATDVAARGIDVQDVTMVVHIDPPMDSETYVHRSGRTGRAGQKGRSVMLALKSHEGRLRRIYAQARVQATWVWPPSPENVAEKQMIRAERHATAAIAAHGLGDAPKKVAAHLLRDRDAVEVVAALLLQAGQGPRPPFVFGPTGVVAVKPERKKKESTESAKEPAAPKAASPADEAPRATAPVVVEREPAVPPPPEPPPPSELQRAPEHEIKRAPLPVRGRARSAPAWQREADEGERAESRTPYERGPQHGHEAGAQAGFTRFVINWGRRDGADPGRILAHVCRRGSIDSGMVGAIEMRGTMSLFDVRNEVAVAFGRRAMVRDRRDPNLRITRFFERSTRGRTGAAQDDHGGEQGGAE